MTRFTPTLGHDPAYMKEDDGSFDFSLTKSEQSVASFGTCHLEDYRRRQNERDEARALAGFTHGLAVKRLDPSELTEEERRSFGL